VTLDSKSTKPHQGCKGLKLALHHPFLARDPPQMEAVKQRKSLLLRLLICVMVTLGSTGELGHKLFLEEQPGQGRQQTTRRGASESDDSDWLVQELIQPWQIQQLQQGAAARRDAAVVLLLHPQGCSKTSLKAKRASEMDGFRNGFVSMCHHPNSKCVPR